MKGQMVGLNKPDPSDPAKLVFKPDVSGVIYGYPDGSNVAAWEEIVKSAVKLAADEKYYLPQGVDPLKLILAKDLGEL